MTGRHAAYLVVLEKDVREDGTGEGILTALRMLKGVISVEPVTADLLNDQIARVRRDREWTREIDQAIGRLRGKP